MKNVHVLPTDKPSRIIIQNVNKLILGKEEYSITENRQNIHITADEEIKEGDWYLIEFNGLKTTQCTSKEEMISIEGRNDCKKIILTTDQDLIKDGVQPIGDEFLEWFVKNPSCQEVEVRKIEDEIISPKNPKIRFNALQDPPSFISAESLNNMILTYKYKIIIPKEEPKQDYSGVHLRHCYQGEYEDGCKYGEDDCPAKPLEEPKQHLINIMKKDEELGLYDIENDWDKILEEYYDQPKLNFISLNKWLKENYEIPKKKMETKQEIKLEDIFNDEKRQGVKELIDKHKQEAALKEALLELRKTPMTFEPEQHYEDVHEDNVEKWRNKQRLEKYSERFDNDESEIGNPDTWGKRVKQETLEEVFGSSMCQFSAVENKLATLYRNQVKIYDALTKQQGYTEEEVRKLLQSQRGNCYVAILTKTRDIELASLATLAPEPGGKDGWVKPFKKK